MLVVTCGVSDGNRYLGLVSQGMVANLTALEPSTCASFATLLAAAAADGTTPARYLRKVLQDRIPEQAYRYDDLAGAAHGGPRLLPPLTPPEVWAAGVTYLRSRDARELESHGATIYDRVYTAERPEVFFKATGWRVQGPGDPIGLRADSHWLVPEPELGLVLDGAGRIVGYTAGNDMSCRDIEGENPLYLPQAKIWKGACAIGPAVLLADEPRHFTIRMTIWRGGAVAFSGETSTAQMKRTFAELVECLLRENEILPGTVLLTGAGIVPPDDFSLVEDDRVEIAVDSIGTLRNVCRPAGAIVRTGHWSPG